jgi:general L-amino acid transport system substrate-binding protein
MERSGAAIAFSVAASLAATAASAQATLNKVKQNGFLVCGSNPALPGFGIPDAQGNWTGFDIDYCRAYAAAIFNDPTKAC